MKLKTTILATAIVGLAACSDGGEGSGSAESQNAGSKGRVTIKLMDAETVSMSGGFYNKCKVAVETRNRLGRDISNLSVQFTSVLAEDAGLLDANTADIVEKHSLYLNGMKKGETKDKGITIKAVTCEGLGALQVVNIACEDDKYDSCIAQVDVEDGGIIKVLR